MTGYLVAPRTCPHVTHSSHRLCGSLRRSKPVGCVLKNRELVVSWYVFGLQGGSSGTTSGPRPTVPQGTALIRDPLYARKRCRGLFSKGLQPMYRSTLSQRRSVATGAPPENIEHVAPENLRLVVLDCPLESWDDEGVRELFGDLVTLKKLGFGASYRDKVLPVDTTDFVGRHYLSCIEGPQGLQVVAGFRAVDFERCRLFNLPFPALCLARAANAPMHAEAVRRFVEQDAAVSYIGSWTIHPGAYANQRLRAPLFVARTQLAYARRHFRIAALQAPAAGETSANFDASLASIRRMLDAARAAVDVPA